MCGRSGDTERQGVGAAAVSLCAELCLMARVATRLDSCVGRVPAVCVGWAAMPLTLRSSLVCGLAGEAHRVRAHFAPRWRAPRACEAEDDGLWRRRYVSFSCFPPAAVPARVRSARERMQDRAREADWHQQVALCVTGCTRTSHLSCLSGDAESGASTSLASEPGHV